MMLSKTFNRFTPYVPLLLRLVVGITFFLHGLQKLQGGIDGTAGFFASLGIPAPQAAALFVALLETVGGLALVLGIGTRLFSLLFIVLMLVAIFTVKVRVGYIGAQGAAGAELDTLLLVGSLCLVILGSGALSIERNVLKRELV
jgi:putative oxidoreductase